MLAVLLAVALFLDRFLCVYRLSDRGVRVKLLGLVTVHRIWWREIESVRIVPVWSSPFAYRIPAYEFSSKRVLIRLRKGLIRSVVLSPKNPDLFVAEVSRRMVGTSTGR